MSDTRLPGLKDRTVVVGRTGTGKSIAGAWHLSLKDFVFPWIVFDTKKEEFFADLWKMPGARRMTFADSIPKTGLWYLQPTPKEMASEACEQFLSRIHQRGRVGLFFDEGYSLDKYSDALTAIYTQGRSLRIPTITLSQKPKYLNPFTFSEAQFFQIFPLNDLNDRKRIAEYTPISPKTTLRDFHSLWYDVGRNSVVEFSPVPAPDRILEQFETKLRFTKRAI